MHRAYRPRNLPNPKTGRPPVISRHRVSRHIDPHRASQPRGKRRQAPSVPALGTPGNSGIGSRAVPVVRLTEVFRQAARSRIHYHRARNQPRGDPRPPPTGPRQRLPLRAGRRPRDGRRPDRRAGEDADTERLRPRPGSRHPGPVPNEPGRRRAHALSTSSAGRAEPGPRAPGRALRLDLRRRRQGDADRQRLPPRHLQRRHRNGSRRQPRDGRADRAVPWRGTHIRLRRARRARAGLRRNGAQEPGIGISGRGHPGAHPALRDA